MNSFRNTFKSFGSALAAFEEPVVVQINNGTGIATRSTVMAALIYGHQLTESAGADAHPTAGADLSVVVRVPEWPFSKSPEFGARVELVDGRVATVQAVEFDGVTWSLACTIDERVEAES